ncbi:MAG: MCP four helix bundle domain-containing protein, partial [Chthoniobacterales bacterium]|nr:MCP four helix bundle domain-containing protein [Chthoniobacterales bacterium]
MNIQNLTISKRITLGFALVLAILLFLGLFALWKMNLAQNTATPVAKEIIPTNSLASHLLKQWEDLALSIRSYGLTGAQQDWQKVQDALKEVENQISRISDSLKKNSSVSQVSPLFNEFQDYADQFFAAIKDTHQSWEELHSATQRMQEATDECIATIYQYLNSVDADLQADLNANAPAHQLRDHILKLAEINLVLDSVHQIKE